MHTHAHEAFRAEVKAFLDSAVPADIRLAVQTHCVLTREQVKRWHVIVHAKGWAAPAWPKAQGGPGWSLAEQAIFKEEVAAADVPNVEHLGIDTIGPTLMRFGTPEQCARFLPRMLSFDDYWAQAYSEPNAGSDLASLTTTATRDAHGDWIVNGAKIWQSMGHWANWAIVLVRSDVGVAKKQDGITVLLVDLTAPGVTVRPIKFINGADFHAQIFFDNVRVPRENQVGDDHQGWAIAKGLLVIERLFVARVGECKAEIRALTPLVQALPNDAANVALRLRFAELQVRMEAHEASWWPALRAAERGESPALHASLLKLDGIDLLQGLQLLHVDVLGTAALRFNPQSVVGQPPESPAHAQGNVSLGFWRYRGSSLAGGSTEVQQGIIAKSLMRGETEIHQPVDVADEVSELLTGLGAWLHKHHAPRFSETPADVWAVAHNMGVVAMGVPEAHGGLGQSPEALMRVMNVLGEHLVRDEILWQSLLPAQLLSGLAVPAAAPLLVALAAGERMAVHWPEPGGVQAKQVDGQWQLSGQAPLIMGNTHAAALLLLAHTAQGTALFHLPHAEWQGRAQPWQLHDGRKAFSLDLTALRVAAAQCLATGAEASRAMLQAQAFALYALSAETLGAAREAIRQTLAFLGERKQFNTRLIDLPQLQTRVVEHFRAWFKAQRYLESAVSDWCAGRQASLATAQGVKLLVGTMARALALDALHLHGAMGYQDETPISHYAKRLFDNDMLLGSAREQAAHRAHTI